jgi:hypothetical protein
MSTFTFARIEERTEQPAGPVDPSPVLGPWHNCDKGLSGGVLSIDLTLRDGQLYAHAYGTGDPDPYDWGEVPATPLATGPASTDGWAFGATYDFGTSRTLIRAYNKLGNLVLVSFNTFHDGSARSAYWTREFFYPLGTPLAEVHTRTAAPAGGITRARDRLAAEGPPPTIDLGPLLGEWINFNADSTGICRAEVEAGPDGQPLVRLFGVGTDGPHDWGQVSAVPFADDVASCAADAFTADYDLGYARVATVGYFQRRLLTVDASTVYTDGSGRTNYFTRAHFYNP